MPRNSGEKFDAYQAVTDAIIRQLEAGTVPWRRPWKAIGGDGQHRNLASKRAYRGANPFMLDAAAMDNGWEQPWWVSYKQAAQLGGQVRRGEHSTIVVFWKRVVCKPRPGEPTDEEGRGKTIFMLRYYRVFNVEQVDGIDGKIPVVDDSEPWDAPAAAEELIRDYLASGPKLRHRGDQAMYQPATDTVTMPARRAFPNPETYFGTLDHELVHSTGHKTRLDREMGGAKGTESYAKEELTAEMGAAFLCRMARIDTPALDVQTAAYIASWLRALRNDNRLVVSAAARAQRAADLITGRTFDELQTEAITHEEKELAHA